MNGMMRIVAAVTLIVGAGLVQGTYCGRFGSSCAESALRARIESLPMTIGDWKGTMFELPAPERDLAGATACFAAVYTNANRGVTVSVLLLGGNPGKISVHTPDICYRGEGYSTSAAGEFDYSYGQEPRHAMFRTIVATRGGTTPSVLRVFWSWNNSKGWSAPEDPRFSFALEPALCKLYVVRETWGQVVDPATDPCKDFLAVFLPEVDRRLLSDEIRSVSR